MPYVLRMPEVAANATHATLVCWNRSEGERIEAGQSIADVETDKAVLELPVNDSAIVGKLLVSNGQDVPVGEPIAVLLQPGETLEDGVQPDNQVYTNHESNIDVLSDSTEVQVPTDDVEPQRNLSSPKPEAFKRTNGRRFTSPAARLLAKQHDLDLTEVMGSGPRGRVTKHDVVDHLNSESRTDNAPVRAAFQFNNGSSRVISPTPTRRTIAKRLSQSKAEVPHFYLRARCNVKALLALRRQINEQLQTPVSINDFVIRAAAVSLVKVPEFNVSWRDDGIHEFDQVDISVAVDTPNGLMTPIVFDAANKTLTAISSEIRELAQLARQGGLQATQFQGGTFSVSNLGMYGVDNFDAILNPPQAGILAVGAVQRVPVIEGQEIVAGQVMDVVLSVDHRAVDGAVGARWLATFRDLIEQPVAMLI